MCSACSSRRHTRCYEKTLLRMESKEELRTFVAPQFRGMLVPPPQVVFLATLRYQIACSPNCGELERISEIGRESGKGVWNWMWYSRIVMTTKGVLGETSQQLAAISDGNSICPSLSGGFGNSISQSHSRGLVNTTGCPVESNSGIFRYCSRNRLSMQPCLIVIGKSG